MPVTKLSTKGQLVLPKAVREALEIEPGDELLVEVEDGFIRIVPRKKRRLVDVLGKLPGHPPRKRFESSAELLQAEREEVRKRWRK
ncbi:AbrB/MazE/SpoVT family DNA-binding domain-containing protein [Oceanithermus sp.]